MVIKLSVLIFSFSVPDLFKYYEAQVLKISGEPFARYAGPTICRNNHLIPNKVYIEHHKISKSKISNMYHEIYTYFEECYYSMLSPDELNCIFTYNVLLL